MLDVMMDNLYKYTKNNATMIIMVVMYSTLTIAAAEGLADELGAIEGELVPFMIPGTAVDGAFVVAGSKGEGDILGGLKKSPVGQGVCGSKVRPRFLTVPRRRLSVAE